MIHKIFAISTIIKRV